MAPSPHDVEVARELGSMNEKLKRIEEILEDMHMFDARISSVEKTISGFKIQVGIVAGTISGLIGFVSWLFVNWPKLKILF
jgi:hypothetical protein